jgi:anti-anti-sigma factor
MIEINLDGDIYEVTFKDIQNLNVFFSEPIKTSVSKLFATQNVKVLINMEGIQFLDSSGFAAFVSLSKEASKTGGQIIFCNIRDSAMKLFRVLQLHQSFRLLSTKEEALQSFK